MEIIENIPLAPFTTFGIGGPARWFVEATSEHAVAGAVGWARERGIPLFVLGGGSNLLVADDGFDGLVMRVALRGIAMEQGILHAGAGEPWDGCVERSLEAEWAGIECLAGIPGTVGGTPVQNVGAYGQEVAPVVERVRAFDTDGQNFVEFSATECGFSYRRSRFNTADRGRFIVTQVDFRLRPGGAATLRYPELRRQVEAAHPGREASIAQVAAIVRRIRQAKGMLMVEGDADCRGAGSFFKNPIVSAELFEEVAARGAAAPPSFPAGAEGMVKIPAAWLIEQAGFAKGYALGNAGISSRHTLALVNRGGATAGEIMVLAERISAAVEARFGIRMEREPVILGFGL
jgi:UDP-N-acetylmuramate dehydrogenase